MEDEPPGDMPCFRAEFDLVVMRKYVFRWIISLFGIFGNILVIYIYSGKRPQAIGEIPVLLLSFVDLAMSMFALVFTSIKAVLKPNARDFNCFIGLCIAGNVAFDITYTFSCAMMCLMAVNRFLAVCRAHSYQLLFTIRRQILVYILLLFFAILASTCGVWSCVTVPNNHAAKLGWIVQRTALLLVTTLFMALCYTKVVSKMRKLKEKVTFMGLL